MKTPRSNPLHPAPMAAKKAVAPTSSRAAKSSPGMPAARRDYKVELAPRVGAAVIDVALGVILGLVFLLWKQWFLTFIILGIYMLVRDGLGIAPLDHQSVGKKLLGLHVENEDTHKPKIDILRSVKRNAILAAGFMLCPLLIKLFVPLGLLVLIAGPAIELAMVIRDPNGLRIGDGLARTKVLD